ncbi:hypothetical protein BEL04_23240 [Mucilaginibacter sp. PPCGB 2223]|nr:hypothetical protein BEL04_23240 [Mucilaginibacter sp. PPCGB 2223]
MLIKSLFFEPGAVRTFFVTRLREADIGERVFLESRGACIDVTNRHSMICLDPFCIAVWLPPDQAPALHTQQVNIQFRQEKKCNAEMRVTRIEELPAGNGRLLLYRLESVKNHQLTALHRLALFGYFLRSKTNTYQSRRVISSLYSYPRQIIMVSYQDNDYYNIFPMDIQGYIPEAGLQLLGLRTTNITLDKILAAKKVVICDTDKIDLETVYRLGKHGSKSPTKKQDMPFDISDSEIFGFPVPATAASYKELEIIGHRKMGYHMLLLGKVANQKVITPDAASLYHVGFLQFQKSNYQKIDGLY